MCKTVDANKKEQVSGVLLVEPVASVLVLTTLPTSPKVEYALLIKKTCLAAGQKGIPAIPSGQIDEASVECVCLFVIIFLFVSWRKNKQNKHKTGWICWQWRRRIDERARMSTEYLQVDWFDRTCKRYFSALCLITQRKLEVGFHVLEQISLTQIYQFTGSSEGVCMNPGGGVGQYTRLFFYRHNADFNPQPQVFFIFFSSTFFWSLNFNHKKNFSLKQKNSDLFVSGEPCSSSNKWIMERFAYWLSFFKKNNWENIPKIPFLLIL